MKSVLMIVAASLAIPLFSAEVQNDAEAKAKYQEEFAKKYYANTGGRVVKPDSGEGKIVFYNAQSKIPEATLKAVLDHMTITLAVRMELVKGEPISIDAFDGVAKKSGGGATIFLLDSATLPLSLVAYENGWGMVNTAPLAASPADKLAERTEKELTRTVGLTCGLAGGMGAASLMIPVRKIEALDNCELPMERGNNMVTGPIHRYLLNFGVTPVTVATYRKACTDGWAPKPKDDAQRALWESTQEKKERGPVNGIKITPKGKDAK